MIQKYIIFYGLKNSPQGGVYDIEGEANSIIEALAKIQWRSDLKDTVFCQIYNLQTKRVVWENGEYIHETTDIY